MPGSTRATTSRPRCAWARGDLDVAYHDREWGVPVRDDRRLFELLTLEGAQAGLSWSTILRKRAGYRRAFAGFDPRRVARFGAADVRRLLADPGIVRHRGKIEATIANARAVLAMRSDGPSLSDLFWAHAPPPRPAPRQTFDDLPATTPESTALAKALKARGFRFVGPTTAYAAMQACGLVDDHLAGCVVRR
jgi:DNA-3-methyladenine glycosylase I